MIHHFLHPVKLLFFCCSLTHELQMRCKRTAEPKIIKCLVTPLINNVAKLKLSQDC
jgi:hypothetical protein